MPTQLEQLNTFFQRNPGVVLSLDEISSGSGIARRSISALISAAKQQGTPLVNPLPGQWALAAPPAEALQVPEAAPAVQAEAHVHELNGYRHNGHGLGAPVDDEAADDDDDDDDDDEADEADEAEEVFTNSGDTVLVRLGAIGVRTAFLVLMHVGHDKAGNRIVADQDGLTYRLVDL